MSEDANINKKIFDQESNSGDISAIIIIDKDKLPEELRNKLPQDLQDKLLELLQEDFQKDKVSQLFQSHIPASENKKSGNLFAMQTGSVVGNIYKDGIFPNEKITQKSKADKKEK